MPKKLLFILLAIAIISLVSAFLALSSIRNAGIRNLNGTFIDPPMPGKGFELTSASGRVNLEEFRGKYVVLVFGYTACPDVCPATMSNLAGAVKRLEDSSKEVQVVLVAVDPERDTPERIHQYAAGFNSDFIGVSGTPEEIASVAGAYGIFYEEGQGSTEAGYLVDHTATVTVLDRDGNTRLLWSFGIGPEEMASDLHYLIRNSR